MQTADDDGKQLQVKHISRLIIMLLLGKQLRVAFTA
jgi:hypothetical protein